MNKTYKIANHIKSENKIITGLKNSFLTEDIGVKSENFTSVILLSTFIAISAMSLMYYFWRI